MKQRWRKALPEAGRFAPAQAVRQPVRPEALAATLCAAPRIWLVGDVSHAAAQPLLAQALVIAQPGRLRLWRVAPGCAQTLTAFPAGR